MGARVLLALAGPLPLPRSGAGWLAVGALAGLAAWSAISIAWAPLVGPAVDSVQRLLLYLGALLAATAVLRDRGLARAVEPALAAGAAIVIGYGLAGRLLPGIVDLNRSLVAGGRLEQPLTYWNAEGLLAAMGFLLCVRLAGDPSRPRWMRVAAAAAWGPLGAGVYVSYSRGALAVAVLGLLFLVAAAPVRPQLRAAVAALATAVVAAVIAAAFRGVAGLEGSGAEQRRDGAIVLAAFVIIAVVAALAQARMSGAERRDPALLERGPYAGQMPAVAFGAAALCVVGLAIGGLAETGDSTESAEARPSRFVSIEPSATSTGAWARTRSSTSRFTAKGRGASACCGAWSATWTPPPSRSTRS